MVGFDTFCAYLLYFFNLLTNTPFNQFTFNVQSSFQKVLPNPSSFADNHKPLVQNYPIFDPPNAPEDQSFTCEYPELPEYEPCFGNDDQGCWLRPKDKNSDLRVYNISTDYENFYPQGITRRYNLTITNESLWADGCENSESKVFNKQYPGPWIEACWGDDIEVTVTNLLPCNGTTVHWHGLRQLHNAENDGVNAVTQCPIAPGDSYTYKFKALQYGSSWYHSHYSLQYPDGLAGPLTIHGPASGAYDHAIDPILMTDWNHRSAFQDWSYSILSNRLPRMTSILLNGKGKFYPSSDDSCINPKPVKVYTRYFQKGVRYLLRLINTSVDTSFVFSIDGHSLTVIQSDFVPIKNYTNSSILIGIGQRYHVIVEASPTEPSLDGNYWIRTVPATGCQGFRTQYTVENSTTGIIRYDPLSTSDPTSKPNQFDIKCSDETYSSLEPILPWTVPEPVEISPELEVSLVSTDSPPYFPDNLARWKLHKAPMWLNFSAPTILNIAEDPSSWAAELSVNTTASSNNEWIEILISGADLPQINDTAAAFPTLAHPIHLHGHDFALLAQSEQPYNEATVVIKRDNPPRRDVALLPAGGYLIIAFKLDNPGIWLMHCHIAWHASSGLAMQILENVDRMKIHNRTGLETTCKNWNQWFNIGRLQHCLPTDPNDTYPFQDDSGI
ncbi:hypothetical protein GQ43DRAFT_471972 [Delitschia confertaspora ATCC 74209]|uniref:Multicopper oxidase n=1 Tax=Delitschia confertaspora ATCC 74209 TaxID=1513339 RepID=A0A9P4MPY6_9PLEO|nr:hypothetical protein GQ43DRAFT_471972 [Delitschia confertaspora ATCC 74209]